MGFRFWLFLFLLLGWQAWAEIEHPLILPIGDREAFMGNAGTAITGSPGNIFYNPAGLDRLTGKRFSASGSAYALVNGRTEVGQDTADFDTVASVPNMLAVTRRVRSWTVAFGIFSPVAIEGDIDLDTQVASAGFDFSVSSGFRTEEQYIGFASGRNIGNGWSFGLGLFGHRYLSKNRTSVFITPNPTPAHISKSERVELEVISLLPILGLQKDISESLRAGLRIAAPDIELLGRSKVNSEEIQESGGTVTLNEVRKESDGNYRLPADVTAGLAWSLGGRHLVTVDVGVQLPIEFDSMPGQVKGTRYKMTTTVRQNLGYEYRWSDEYSVLAGLMRSPYAAGKSQDKEGNAFSPKNFFGGTLGFYSREKSSTSGVGVFYANSRQDGKILGFQKDTRVGYNVYGLMLSTSIDY